MNISDKFIKYLFNLSQEPLTEPLKKAVNRCFLDYLGATLAGAKMLGRRGDNFISVLGEGKECTIIGYKKRGTLHTSTFVNGFSSHTAELDDGVISGIIHPGAPVFTSLISVAEKYNCSYDQFAMGAFIGYEAGVRLANAIQPNHKKLGYHASGTCGLIGAALGVGVMMKQSEKHLKDTLSAAVAAVHGTLKVLEDNSELKPYNIASSSSDAVVAAIVSNAGFQGPEDPLGGYAGFFAQNSGDNVKIDKLFKSENQSFAIEDVYVKPYAACRYCHPSIENALHLKSFIADSDNIEEIIIKTYELAVNKHDMTAVENISAAKMSIPFATAVSLIKGSASVDAYSEESVNDSNIKELMKKVKVLPDEEFSNSFPKKSIATMEIKLKNGERLHFRTDSPKGEADAPLSDKELSDKFHSLAIYGGLTYDLANKLSQKIREGNFSIKEILSHLN